MFALSFAIAALAAASCVAGFPTKRAGAPSCANLGSIGFTNSGPFTLVAFDSAGNSMPLVFREESVLDGGDVAYVISTDSSGNSNPFPTLSLQDGRLIPMAMNGTGAHGSNVVDGLPISFITGSDVDPSTGAQEYCGANVNSTITPLLAVDSVTDSFNLCPDGGSNSVFFRPETSGCEPIEIQIVF